MYQFWKPLSPGWFIQWAVKNKASEHPRKAITVFHDGMKLCGFVPNDWDGEVVNFDTNPSRWLSTGEGVRLLAHDD